MSTPADVVDRCDRCGAAAAEVFHLRTGDLAFCGHHARDYREKLEQLEPATAS